MMAWIFFKEAKFGLNIDSANLILLLSYRIDCHHWNRYTGVQPKDKAIL